MTGSVTDRAASTDVMTAEEEEGGRPGWRASTPLVQLLVELLEYRDPFFRGGSSFTRLIALSIGRELRLGQDELDVLELAAVLRDLGRMALGGRLVDRPRAELAPDARMRIENHVEMALRLLNGIPLPDGVRETIRHHHERWDGHGYPDGLRGEAIPLTARIIAVADAFVAMMSPRPYRPPRRLSPVLDEIRDQSGQQFDPSVVNALLRTVAFADPWRFRSATRHHIIIAHSQEMWATVLSVRLCLAGYVTEVVDDLESARARLRRVPAAAVVVSADMPDENPVGFLRELRDDSHLQTLPVVAIGADTVDRRVELLESGASVCFPTEVSFDELRATLGTFFACRTLPGAGENGEGEPEMPKPPWHALHGNLEDFPLPWLLQALNYDARTAAVAIRTADNAGMICLENGDPYQAQTRRASGEDALREILSWKSGTFAVQPGARPRERNVERSLMHVLLDYAITEDQASVTFGAVPTG